MALGLLGAKEHPAAVVGLPKSGNAYIRAALAIRRTAPSGNR